MSPSKRWAVRIGARTLISLGLCAAVTAAVIAHVAIDILGDYALTADSYDSLRHGSRELASFVAFILAVTLAVRGLRICCEIAAANRTRILLPAHRLRDGIGFVLAAMAVAVLLVPAMEWLDGRVDGAPVLSFNAAFGGSLWLGLGTTILCSAIVALAAYAFARWLISHRDSIATIIETLLRRAAGKASSCGYERARRIAAPRRRTVHALRLSKRGPPVAIFA
jgi:ABC-type glycerol-3-phosphate transport system permease component